MKQNKINQKEQNLSNKISEVLDLIDEMGSTIPDARNLLKNIDKRSTFAEHIIKLYFFNKIRKDDINSWKRSVREISRNLRDSNLDKSNKFNNFTLDGLREKYHEFLNSRLESPESINNMLTYLHSLEPDKYRQQYPLMKTQEADVNKIKQFLVKIDDYVSNRTENIDFTPLGV